MWYASLGAVQSWDFLPVESESPSSVSSSSGWDELKNSTALVAMFSSAHFVELNKHEGNSNWRGNSALVTLSPLGEAASEYEQACTGSPMNYNALANEVRLLSVASGRELEPDLHSSSDAGSH